MQRQDEISKIIQVIKSHLDSFELGSTTISCSLESQCIGPQGCPDLASARRARLQQGLDLGVAR